MMLRLTCCAALLSLVLCSGARAVPFINCSISNPAGYVLQSTIYNTVDGNDMAACDFTDSGSRASASAGGGVSLAYTTQLGAFNSLSVYQILKAVTNMDNTGATVGTTFTAAAVALNETLTVN